MNSIRSKTYVRVITGRNAGRCGLVISTHTYPPPDANSTEIRIASVRISGVPTQWYRSSGAAPEIEEVSQADAERSERGPRAAA